MSTMEATVLMPLTPNLTAEGGRVHLRETLSLMRVLEGRDASLTLGDLQSLADDFGENYDDNYRERDNRHGKGRGGGGIVDSGGMSLLSLIGTPLFLYLRTKYHCC